VAARQEQAGFQGKTCPAFTKIAKVAKVAITLTGGGLATLEFGGTANQERCLALALHAWIYQATPIVLYVDAEKGQVPGIRLAATDLL